jgi:hypothetical protein
MRLLEYVPAVSGVGIRDKPYQRLALSDTEVKEVREWLHSSSEGRTWLANGDRGIPRL